MPRRPVALAALLALAAVAALAAAFWARGAYGCEDVVQWQYRDGSGTTRAWHVGSIAGRLGLYVGPSADRVPSAGLRATSTRHPPDDAAGYGRQLDRTGRGAMGVRYAPNAAGGRLLVVPMPFVLLAAALPAAAGLFVRRRRARAGGFPVATAGEG
ncbi:MAG: hypothetical protein JWO31_548, partial [Phycisphaerales bacterium]|nr:hypothetical protein [Phycisphaerales bacterium]